MKSQIWKKLEVGVHTRRKPPLIISNVPEDITTNNIEETILKQTTEINLHKGNIVYMFIYVNKKKTVMQ